MSLVGAKSQELQKRAQRVLPLGVNSNFHYWGKGITPYVDRGTDAVEFFTVKKIVIERWPKEWSRKF